MKIQINKIGMQGVPTRAVIEHKGRTLEYNIALFEKMSYAGDFDIFEQINGYWEYLKDNRQDELFEIYVEIRAVFDMYLDNRGEMTRQLHQLVARLYQYHELADVKHWLSFHSNTRLPDGVVFADTFSVEMEDSKTREQTYLKDDYLWLVAVSVALRPMIPVWGEFISLTRKETGTTLKEYFAYKLLAYSNLIKSEPMQRLQVYVEYSIPAEKTTAAAVFGGISTEDFPLWILSLVLIRRLSIGDVRGIKPGSSLVSFIHNYIRQKVRGHDNSFVGMIKPKQIEGQGTDSESKLSKLEGYKMKQDISDGNIAVIRHYAANPDILARRLCPDLDMSLLQQSLHSTLAFETVPITDPQIILMQWVLKRAIPPQGILYLNKPTCMAAMAVTQSLLWHRGHYDCAALVSSIWLPEDGEMYLDTTEARSQISKAQVEKLELLYPYRKRTFTKQKTARKTNPAVESIESLASGFIGNNWMLTLPPDWIEKLTGNRNLRRYNVPADIRIKLANLAISLAERSF